MPFHICAKIFKGKGSLQSSVVIFLYMTALFPIFKLLCLPAETITRQFILDKTIDIDFYLQLSSIGNDSPFFMLWSVLQLIGLIFYAIYLNIGFKIVHKIDDVRGFLTVFLGIICWQLFEFTIVLHVMQMLFRAYK
jgi:hypothetical protein